MKFLPPHFKRISEPTVDPTLSDAHSRCPVPILYNFISQEGDSGHSQCHAPSVTVVGQKSMFRQEAVK